MKIPASVNSRSFEQGTRLYDLESDPEQSSPIQNKETEDRMRRLMGQLMQRNEAPKEQYERVGLDICPR